LLPREIIATAVPAAESDSLRARLAAITGLFKAWAALKIFSCGGSVSPLE
jgi:hypothetical protein